MKTPKHAAPSKPRPAPSPSKTKTTALYGTLLDLADDAIIACDFATYTITYWNNGAEKMYGWRRAEALGQPIHTLLHTHATPSLAEVKAHFAQAGNWTGELLQRTKTGEALMVASRWTLQRDAAGNPLALLKIDTDITTRKQVEQQLLYQSTLLANVNDAIVASNAHFQLTAWNAGAEALYGWTAAEVLGRNGVDIIRTEWPAAQAEEMRRTITATGRWRGEATQLRKDGTRIPVDVSSIVLHDENGQVSGYVSVNRDITERKQTENALRLENERFLRFVESNIIGIVIANAKGKIVLANDYYLNILGVTRQAFQADKVDWRQFTPPEWLPADEQAIRELQIRGVCQPYEKEYVRTDGRRIPVYIADALLPGPEEQIAAFILDITDRKQAEAKIRVLNAELEQRVADRTAQLEAANKELEAFSYSVSHDLRAPLRAMDGFSRILLDDFGPHLPADAQRYLNLVRANTVQMGHLVDDLLAFSRLSRQPINKQAVNLEQLARHVFDELHVALDAHPVELVIGSLPPGYADPTLLKQVIVNLLTNALKFTRQRSPARIEIGCTVIAAVPSYFVKDNGVGFDMKYVGKLFGVFQRLHRAEEYEGTGVGLAIVQRIIHRHGGRVWAEGAVNQGATFYFTL